MERVYIFDCDRIIGDEEKRTIIENMEGKAEVIFDNSEGYDRDTDIVISTRCVGNSSCCRSVPFRDVLWRMQPMLSRYLHALHLR